MSSAQTWLVPFGHSLSGAQEWAASLLGAVEAAEIRMYSSDTDRQCARASRAAGRLAATRHVQGTVAPESWMFERADHGGRRLRAPDGRLVHISIADNENTLVVCADASEGSGVDIESWRPQTDWEKIANRFYAPQEKVALEALPRDEAAALFKVLWTGKEAAAKAQARPLADRLGLPVAPSTPIDLGRWLAHGIACAEYELRWFDLGADLLATCGAAKRQFAKPRTVTLEALAKLTDAKQVIAPPG